MANGINLGFAFNRTSPAPIDTSMVMTKAEMRAVDDSVMPDYYFAICKEDKSIYLYDKSATASTETGKYTLYSSGGGDVSMTHQSTLDGTETTLTDGTNTLKVLLNTDGRIGVEDGSSSYTSASVGDVEDLALTKQDILAAGSGVTLTNNTVGLDYATAAEVQAICDLVFGS